MAAAFSSGVILASAAFLASLSAFSAFWSTGGAGDLSSAIAATEPSANVPAINVAISLFIDVSSEKKSF
ncbi:MAG: hypothetical protein E6H55_14375 [Betaproteobacteria bacterium]|nr:MAG: hypothetical protein E6H55_14375 [Betaproteobacteria bacterium]